MRQTIIITGRLPGYNELHGAKCWQASRRIKQEGMNAVMAAVRVYRARPVEKYPVTITIACFEPNNRRDRDNVSSGANKVILDALQRCKIIVNDNAKCVDKVVNAVTLDREHPRVEVYIDDLA